MQELLVRWRTAGGLDVDTEELLVRQTLSYFAQLYPGRSVEIRVPWVSAVQAISGVTHRRGTPPNIVELSAKAWLHLVVSGEVLTAEYSASGSQSDITQYFPLFSELEN
ncbi:MAG: sterol carrier family protein [Arcanobacterium sp.]|nr:sterol carrier family protein [Arcanobacterium sp.]